MRFDDSLNTVLLAETASGVGAQAAWRQLVDLIGRGRVPVTAAAIERLRDLRSGVPASVRAASARSLTFASPPAALVALFGEDAPDVAAPVLRTATLASDEWAAILPRLSPAGRSVLRHRRDLPAATYRALEAFGATDFVLHYDAPAAPLASVTTLDPLPIEPDGFTRETSIIIDALREAEPPAEATPKSEIADLVARIDAFRRNRERPAPARTLPPEGFRFETDAVGAISWIEGIPRGPLVGLCLANTRVQGQAQVDGVVAGACRSRSAFLDARLAVGGESDAAGSWRLSGIPAFDPATGRFLGYRGTGRRPRADESAAPRQVRETSDSLRQLVHELRTPTSAIAGFAELIETELLGPVADPYRRRATTIREQACALIDAIEDLDTAARIENQALDLRPSPVSIRPLAARALAELAPLADLRGVALIFDPDGEDCVVDADDRTVERLVTRLLAAAVSAGQGGERIGVAVAASGGSVLMTLDKPVALDAVTDAAADAEGAPLLGTAFALRLADNLAAELGGALLIDGDRLTLRLPAAVEEGMGQASTN